jgi:hypothetical protein
MKSLLWRFLKNGPSSQLGKRAGGDGEGRAAERKSPNGISTACVDAGMRGGGGKTSSSDISS